MYPFVSVQPEAPSGSYERMYDQWGLGEVYSMRNRTNAELHSLLNPNPFIVVCTAFLLPLGTYTSMSIPDLSAEEFGAMRGSCG